MKYLKLFENFKPIKLLYLHGLDGSQNKEQLDYLKELGFDVIAPEINYRKEKCWSKLVEMDFDVVVGHSMGSYFSFYLSNIKKLPCFMFMPCFDKAIQKLQPLSEEILELPVYKNKYALIGSLDRSINRKIQKEMLNNDNIKTYVEKIDHDVPLDIFKKYMKIFKNSL